MDELFGLKEVEIASNEVTVGMRFLRYAGLKGCEGIFFWVGKQQGTSFKVTECLIPKQIAYRTESGVCVVVDDDELRKLNLHLFQNQEKLIAQVHSHPGKAYHSEMDDEYAIPREPGSFSFVVPDFAAGEFHPSTIAAYRLSTNGQWQEVGRSDLFTLINLVE